MRRHPVVMRGGVTHGVIVLVAAAKWAGAVSEKERY